jgi:hypothetical protein
MHMHMHMMCIACDMYETTHVHVHVMCMCMSCACLRNVMNTVRVRCNPLHVRQLQCKVSRLPPQLHCWFLLSNSGRKSAVDLLIYEPIRQP